MGSGKGGGGAPRSRGWGAEGGEGEGTPGPRLNVRGVGTSRGTQGTRRARAGAHRVVPQPPPAPARDSLQSSGNLGALRGRQRCMERKAAPRPRAPAPPPSGSRVLPPPRQAPVSSPPPASVLPPPAPARQPHPQGGVRAHRCSKLGAGCRVRGEKLGLLELEEHHSPGPGTWELLGRPASLGSGRKPAGLGESWGHGENLPAAVPGARIAAGLEAHSVLVTELRR